MAMSSLRCIAFAYCPWELSMVPKEDLDKWQLPEDNLTLLGMLGIKVCLVSWCLLYASVATFSSLPLYHINEKENEDIIIHFHLASWMLQNSNFCINKTLQMIEKWRN
jgi:hypothetical protein